mgnify:FL=1
MTRTPYAAPPRRVDYWTMAFGIIGTVGLVVGLAVGALTGWILRAVAKEKGW